MTKAVETSQQTLTEKINNLKERRETRELKHLNTMKRFDNFLIRVLQSSVLSPD